MVPGAGAVVLTVLGLAWYSACVTAEGAALELGVGTSPGTVVGALNGGATGAIIGGDP